MASEILRGLSDGFALAVQFNPLVGVFGAALAAGLAGSKNASRDRMVYALSTLLIAWLIGDGLRIMGRVQDHFFEGATTLRLEVVTPVEAGVALGVWALGSLAIGYVTPAWAGAFTGRRVTFGTGWLTAVTVSVAASLALSTIAAGLAI